MEFEWDGEKSDRNRTERGLTFDLAPLLFDSPVLCSVDNRRNYGEIRVRALGVVGGRGLHCAYTDRGDVRRIISLRSRKERDAYRAAFAE